MNSLCNCFSPYRKINNQSSRFPCAVAQILLNDTAILHPLIFGMPLYFQINHQFNQFEKKRDYGELLLVNLKVSYRSLSNIPIMRRQVSALKGVMFPFNKAFLNSSAVILPDLSWSTACRTKILTMLNVKTVNFYYLATWIPKSDYFQSGINKR